MRINSAGFNACPNVKRQEITNAAQYPVNTFNYGTFPLTALTTTTTNIATSTTTLTADSIGTITVNSAEICTNLEPEPPAAGIPAQIAQ